MILINHKQQHEKKEKRKEKKENEWIEFLQK